MSRPYGAVAVDLGASSVRFAAGWLEGGLIKFEVVHQGQNEPVERKGKLYWDFPALLRFCREAVQYASENFDQATCGIDSWAVDHGFIDAEGRLADWPVAYRDSSHVAAFNQLGAVRHRLFELTGIQHQPFNTLYQLVARRLERPEWVGEVRWLLLPDLLAYELCGADQCELTNASTTQLLGLDGNWSPEAFEIAGWPVPEEAPACPGQVVGQPAPNVNLVSVASHDTASAVLGFGSLGPGDVYLNAGTWSLMGALLDQPIASKAAELAHWTNERAHDGRIRFLKNIPGFYVANRLRSDLAIRQSTDEWLASADPKFKGRFDPFHESLFNPAGMAAACRALATVEPTNSAQWAALALGSLADAVAGQPEVLESLTGVQPKRIRISGGGSHSAALCHAIADRTGLPVLAGPAETTVLGNLGLQFVAAGHIKPEDLAKTLAASAETTSYPPRSA